jgi:hypothetical protein
MLLIYVVDMNFSYIKIKKIKTQTLQVIIFHEQKNSVQAFGFQIFLFSLLLLS